MPRTVRGAQPLLLSIWAPMALRGAITRCMGRLLRDSSPTSLAANSCPASRPMRMRMAVPELPRSSGALGALRPMRPRPCTWTRSAAGMSTFTPRARTAARVARQSAPGRNPLMRVSPSAMAPSSSARWEMDLSPGTVSLPLSLPPGATAKSTRALEGVAVCMTSGLQHLLQGAQQACVLFRQAHADAQVVRQAVGTQGAHDHALLEQRLEHGEAGPAHVGGDEVADGGDGLQAQGLQPRLEL